MLTKIEETIVTASLVVAFVFGSILGCVLGYAISNRAWAQSAIAWGVGEYTVDQTKGDRGFQWITPTRKDR